MSANSYHQLRTDAVGPPSGCPVRHDWDPLSHDYLDDPYAIAHRLRDESPIFYSPSLGYVVVNRMEDVAEVFSDPDTYSSTVVQDPVFPLADEASEVLAAPDFDPVAVMSNRPEPDHGRIRIYTTRGFSNRRLATLEPYVRRRSHELVDAMLDAGGPTEFVEAFAFPLPGETVFRFIGFPEADDELLKQWCGDRKAFSWGHPSAEEQVQIAEQMLAYWRYCREFTASKRDDRADDFASELLDAHDADADELSYREVESILYGLSFAGHEPVTLLLGNALLTLLPRRDVWDAICTDPSSIGDALEEVIRWNSPQIGWRRVTTQDTTLGGVDLPAGTQIYLNLGAANHDPQEFEDPETYDMHRANARNNISFGKGNHYCLGAKFARFEARVVLEVLTERVPTLRLVEGQHLDRFPNISFRGPSELLVAWDR